MSYQVIVLKDGDEQQVLEVDRVDSGDPATAKLVVYVQAEED